MIAPALWLKTIPDLLDTNSTHRGIAYVHLTAPHSCDYMGYVRHVGHAARSSTKSHVIIWARIRQVLIDVRSSNISQTVDVLRISANDVRSSNVSQTVDVLMILANDVISSNVSQTVDVLMILANDVRSSNVSQTVDVPDLRIHGQTFGISMFSTAYKTVVARTTFSVKVHVWKRTLPAHKCS